jgi:hypothetical protein
VCQHERAGGGPSQKYHAVRRDRSRDRRPLFDEAKNWADGKRQSKVRSNAMLSTSSTRPWLDAGKRLDAQRVEEKRPLDEQVQAIQDRYNPFTSSRGSAARWTSPVPALNPVRAAWKEAQRKLKEAAALKARLEAEELRRKADEAMRASSGNLEAREQAEEKLDFAKEAERFADKQETRATTGLGLRTTYRPEIADLSVAIKHYWAAKRTAFEASTSSSEPSPRARPTTSCSFS